MTSKLPQPNPYASPAAVTDARSIAVDDETLRLLERPIRWYWPILGALWMFAGVIGSSLGLLLLKGSGSLLETLLIAAAVFGFGSLTLIVGLMTFFRRIWAVYIGLVGSYLALGLSLPMLVAGFWFPAVVFGAAVLMAHRVISYSGQLASLRASAGSRRALGGCVGHDDVR